MIEITLEGEEKVGVIVPHGVLSREAAEGKIHRKMLEDNLLEAVIGLLANQFFGKGSGEESFFQKRFFPSSLLFS